MKFGNKKIVGILLAGVSLLSSVAFAGSPNWAAPNAPGAPLSKEACELEKPYAYKELQDGQAARDYNDNQYAFYQSVAQQIYDKLAKGIPYLNEKYKHFAVEALSPGARADLGSKVTDDLQSSFFSGGYTFCPANSEAVDADADDDGVNVRTCKPNKGWKQVNDYPPYGVKVQAIDFSFTGGKGKPVPTINIKYVLQDVVIGTNDEHFSYSYKGKVYTRAQESTDFVRSYPFDQFTVANIFKDIWPNKGAPTLSPRPDAVLKSILAAKGCEIYEPDYKPNSVIRAKVVDERTTPATESGGKAAGKTTTP